MSDLAPMFLSQDLDRARQVYQACLKLIPHKQFTFAKVWLLYAKHLIRRKDITGARKILGVALGTCPKEKLFRGYIELELKLREFDRARTLYQKYLEWNPQNCYAWVKFAELERMLGDTERAEGVFEIATAQPALDMPEVLWKAYIDFEVAEEEWDKARRLYEKLLKKTEHVKVGFCAGCFTISGTLRLPTQIVPANPQVWISFANFEFGATSGPRGLEDLPALDRARSVFDRAHTALKRRMPDSKEERVFLLETWKDFEKRNGSADDLQKLEARMPRVVKKRRRVEESGVWEEYLDYIFPDDEKEKTPALKLLALAHKWKQQQAATGGSAGEGKVANGDEIEIDEDDDDEEEEDESEEEESEGKNGGEKTGPAKNVDADDSDDDDDDGEEDEE